ncbi:MAG: DUF4236 domain-containing protein [Bacteroidota bacterium]
MRYRKRISILPGLTINLSKSGISTTLGVKGFSVNVGSKGTYLNTGIPGTGLYDRTKISNNLYNSKSVQSSHYNSGATASQPKFIAFAHAERWIKNKTCYTFYFLLLIVGIGAAFFNIPISIALISVYLVLMLRWIFTDAGKACSEIREARKLWNTTPEEASDNILQHLENSYGRYKNQLLIKDIIFQAKTLKKYEVELKFLNFVDVDDSTTIFELAECNFALEHYVDAVKYYDKITLTPQSDTNKNNIYSKLGIALYHIKEYKRAIETLQKVSLAFEQQSLLKLIEGQCFYALKEYETAIFTFTTFLINKSTFDSNMLEMGYNLGLIYKETNNKEKAVYWLNMVYTRDINYKNTGELIKEMV